MMKRGILESYDTYKIDCIFASVVLKQKALTNIRVFSCEIIKTRFFEIFSKRVYLSNTIIPLSTGKNEYDIGHIILIEMSLQLDFNV